MTCFLEYEKDHVKVHDIIYTRAQSGWTQKVSWYPKLRIAKNEMIEILEKNNLKVSHLSAARGMTFIAADRRY